MPNINLKVASDIAVAALRSTMEKAQIPSDQTEDWVRHFTSEWTRMTGPVTQKENTKIKSLPDDLNDMISRMLKPGIDRFDRPRGE